MLTFEQCKKLCKYYKRKDPANYGLVLNTVTEEVSEPRDTNNFIGHLDEPIDDNEILEANDIVDGICKDALVASASAGWFFCLRLRGEIEGGRRKDEYVMVW